MGVLKWFKWDPRAALTGMMILSLEERGAYITVLNLIYARDGELADDEETICTWLRCTPRVWKRLRARLIVCGKLYVHNGMLHNSRADTEALEALKRVKDAVLGADKRWGTYREIKSLQDARAMQPTPTSTKLSYLVDHLKK